MKEKIRLEYYFHPKRAVNALIIKYRHRYELWKKHFFTLQKSVKFRLEFISVSFLKFSDRLKKQLEEESYECMICCQVIRANEVLLLFLYFNCRLVKILFILSLKQNEDN